MKSHQRRKTNNKKVGGHTNVRPLMKKLTEETLGDGLGQS
ncbi:MAG: hypothetical protein ACJAYC_002772 [Halieaceae bacterium]|jgi:hypothetical protein